MYIWGCAESGERVCSKLRMLNMVVEGFVDGTLSADVFHESIVDGEKYIVYSGKSFLKNDESKKVIIASSAYKDIIKSIEVQQNTEIVGIYNKRLDEIVPYGPLFSMEFVCGKQKLSTILERSAERAEETKNRRMVFVMESRHLNVDDISPFLRDDCVAIPWKKGDVIPSECHLLISNQDVIDDVPDCSIIVWDTLLRRLSEYIARLYREKEQYYHLKYVLERGKSDQTVDTIITGSSYAHFGIDETILTHCVKCALPSQDLYYSVKCIESIMEQNKNIENVVICSGYYYLYSDLSMTQNESELRRISRVYFPIFSDMNHSMILPPSGVEEMISPYFDPEKMAEIMYLVCREDAFYSFDRNRFDHATKMWKNKKKKWNEITEEERIAAGRERAYLHNRAWDRKQTRRFSEALVEHLEKICLERSIRLFWVIMPMSEQYRGHLLDEFKRDFLMFADVHQLNLIDYSDDAYFEIDDFNDMDHLNEKGARKLTLLLNEMLNT